MRSRLFRAVIVCAAVVPVLVLDPAGDVRAVSPNVVISQIYGGGGNSGSTYKNDFIELYNRGTAPVNLTGWSVQYASNTSGTWAVTSLSGSIAPGAFYLVQEAAGPGGTTSLPTPNATGTISMSATAGKVALVSTTTALSGTGGAVPALGLGALNPNPFPSCPTNGQGVIVDFVGFGSSASCFEGTTSNGAPAPSNINAILRKFTGTPAQAQDTDVNSTDFATGVANPRTSTPVSTNPSATLTASPSTVTAGSSTTLTVTVVPGFNPASTGMTVTANLTAIGGSAAQTFASAGSNQFTFTATVPVAVTPGNKSINATVTDAQSRSGSAPATVTVLSPAPTNPTATGTASPAAVLAGATTRLIVQVTPGANPPSSGMTVAANLSSIGGSPLQLFSDDGTNGDQMAGDNRFTYDALVAASAALGGAVLPVSLSDAEGRTGTTTISLTVLGPAPKGVVVSQVYGAGGNSGALFNSDYIELYNSTGADVDLTGWSVQYASAAGTSWNVTALTGTIGAGAYYLVRESGGNTGAPLPPVDASGSASMSASSGKVALVNNTLALTGDCPAASIFIADFVGYGASATCFEGPGPTGTLSAAAAAVRLHGGATDTDDNAADFDVATPQPRSRAGIPPSGTGLASPQTVPNGTPSLLTVTVTPGSLPASTSFTVTADLTAIQGSSMAVFVDNGTQGDAVANDRVFSLLQVVQGPPAVRTFTATITDDFSRTSTASIRVGLDSPSTIAVHDIQGPGNVTPLLDGSYVTTTGIVTALKLNGVFVQTPDAEVDNDPDTSEGIFVFTGSAPPAFLHVGDLVVATGTPQEFVPSSDPGSPPTTEIVNAAFRVLSSGNPLPAPVTLLPQFTTSTGGFEQLERFEGMRIRTNLVVVAPTQAASSDEKNATSVSNGIFYGVIQGVPRPLREPGLEPTQALPAGAPATVPRFDGNPERLRVDSDALLGAATLDVVAGQTFANFTGVLDYTSRSYTILPDPLDAGGNLWQPAGSPLAIAVPVAGPNEFTVAHFNLERFFDSVDDPAKSDVALTPAALDGRLNKASLAIRHVLRSPDILGVVEVENLGVLQQLAARISADAVGANEPDPKYAAYLEEGNDIGGIDVGYLVKVADDKVRVLNVLQIGKDTDFTFAGATAKLNDRPSLVLEADVRSQTGRAYPVTVIVNHLRSLSGIDGADADRIRHKRQAQAEFLAGYIQGRQTQHPDEWLVSVGDYNAFQFNDGYVDVLGTIAGAPAPADEVALASSDLVEPNLTNLVERLSPEQRYSFSFDGNAQAIDHVLVNQGMLNRFARLAFARVNADFPEAFRRDITRPERISDHDAPVAFFSFPGAPSIALNGAAEMTVEFKSVFTDPGVTASDPVYQVTVTTSGSVDTGTLGDYTLTYTASNPFLSASLTRTVHVVDTIAPVITLLGGADVTLEAASAAAYLDPGATASDERAGDLTAAIVVSGAVQINTLGTYRLTYTVTDGYNTSSATRTVQVIDTTPPVLTLNGDAAVSLEAGTAWTDPGATATDSRAGVLTTAIQVTGSVDSGTVGTYTLTYTVSDGLNTSTATRTVSVADTIAPVLTLTGAAAIIVEGGTTFADPGAAATDSRAGDLTAAIVVTGAVNTAVVGTYTLTYTVSDGYNTSTATRTVTVIDTTAPVITGVSTSQVRSKSRGRVTVDLTVAYQSSDVMGTPVCTLSVAAIAASKGGRDDERGKDRDGRKDKDRDREKDKEKEVTWQILDLHHIRFAGPGDRDDRGQRYAITIGCADGSGNKASATTIVTLDMKERGDR
jgi:uncharacterized protein